VLEQVKESRSPELDITLVYGWKYFKAGCSNKFLFNFLQSVKGKFVTSIRDEVLSMLQTSILIFSVATPCGFLGRYQYFGGTNSLLLQG
jgi:hypothetical protein